jgi:DNA mismatch repair protein MutS2
VDPHALEAIEFAQVLELLADRCETEAAASAARALEPRTEPSTVQRLQDETSEARRLLETDVVVSFSGFRDVGAAVDGARRGMHVPGNVLFRVYETLLTARKAHAYFMGKSAAAPTLADVASRIVPQPDLERRISETVLPDGQVKDSASTELARLRSKKAVLAGRVTERMQALCNRYRDSLSDSVVTQRSGRWCLPVRSDHKGAVRGIVHDTSATGMTVFVEPEEVVAIGNELREVEAQERHETERILRELSGLVGTRAEDILGSLAACKELDLILAKARLSLDFRCVPPRISDTPRLSLRQARHPLLPPDEVVATDLDVGQGYRCLLITGPNTGGKTVVLKLAGLAVAMTQCGLHVPAADAVLSVFPQVWADIGDEQSLQQSLSTFSAHLRNIQRMLDAVQPGALVLLDEIGAGTDPTEGAALAKSILNHLLRVGALTLCSTHYGELKAFAYNTDGMQNASMEFDVESLRPTYRLRIGIPGASHALTIAQRYGIPSEILEEARAGLSVEQQEVMKMLEKLDLAQKQADSARADAERLSKELQAERRTLQERIREADEARRKARESVAEQMEAIRKELRAEAEQLFEKLRAAPSPSRETEKAREDLKALDAVAREFVEEMEETPTLPTVGRAAAKGDTVRVRSYGQTGRVVSDLADGRVQVQVGALKLTVGLEDLEVLEEPKKAVRPTGTGRMALRRAVDISPELHIRQMRAEDALEELERYMDDAVLAGLDRVRIVHGKGAGTLRKLVHEFLGNYPGVAGYRLGAASEGGAGVTIAELKR